MKKKIIFVMCLTTLLTSGMYTNTYANETTKLYSNDTVLTKEIAPNWVNITSVAADLFINNGRAVMTGRVIGNQGTESISVDAILERANPNGTFTRINSWDNISTSNIIWTWSTSHYVARGHDYRWFSSVEEISSNSTDVVRVEVLDERTELINIWLPPENEFEYTGQDLEESYFVYTVNRVRVIETFLGDTIEGDIIEVRQIGGYHDGLLVVSHDYVGFEINDDLVLFLYSLDQSDLPASLVNPIQSVFRFGSYIENFSASNPYIELDALHEENNIAITLSDLRDLSN